MYAIEIANQYVGIATLLLQLATAAALAVFLLRRRVPLFARLSAFAGFWGLAGALVLSLGATALSLYYSEALGIAPCSLCWIQRMFLYPQVILFAAALYKREARIADYSIALSVLGAAVALYQHALQMGFLRSDLPCPATAAEAVDCHVRFLFEMSYITFPLACFTVFAALIVAMLFVRASR